MRIVSWNMGCAPPPSPYRRTHREAWRYLLQAFQPDVAFVQETLVDVREPEEYGTLVWSEDKGRQSGTAVLVRHGLPVERMSIRSHGSYVAGARVPLGGAPALFISIHVGPPDYRKHLEALAGQLTTILDGCRFVAGGDLNAARHLDDVQGGRWFTAFFEGLAARQLHDCHWMKHGREVQSLWRRAGEEPYQCDHLFVDALTARAVVECRVIDTPEVRALSDHGPLQLDIDERLLADR